jgi:hypothetical protein
MQMVHGDDFLADTPWRRHAPLSIVASSDEASDFFFKKNGEAFVCAMQVLFSFCGMYVSS